MDFLLVNMPFHRIRWPSIALGLLKAILLRNGFSCRVLYGNLLYADRMGLRAFTAGRESWNSTYLGDWLFQRALFPDHPIAPDDFFSGLLLEEQSPEGEEPVWSSSNLLKFRERSEEFLHELAEDIISRSPTAVGCTLTVPQLFPSLALLKRIKETSPEIVTLAGGPACEAGMGKALHESFPFIDFVASGDGDEIIVPLADGIRRRGRDIEAEELPEGVLGPIHRERGYPKGDDLLSSRAKIYSLDGLPPPDYDDYFETLNKSESLRERIHPALVFETSRGCWWGEKVLCKFCGDCGAFPKYRTKSAGQALDEIAYLYQRYKIKSFVATDNAFNPDYFESFLPRLAEINDDFSLFFEVRASVTKEQVRQLRRAGVTYLQAGIESLDSEALREIDKGVEAWENIQCLKWCRQFGISVSWFFMTRLPREKDRWHQGEADLVPLLTHLQPPNFVGFIRPDRYSRYFKEAEKYGLDIRPKERYLRLFPLPPEKVSGFVFHLVEMGIKSQITDELDFVLRSGIFALKKAARRWREEFQGPDEPARLEMSRQGETLVILDTRRTAISATHHLEGLKKDILLSCDRAPLVGRLLQDFEEKGFNRAEIEESLQDLINKKLVLPLDGRMISLVLEAPILDYVPQKEQAIGWIEGEDEGKSA